MDTQIKIGRFNYLQCLVYFLKVVMFIGDGGGGVFCIGL